MVIQKTVNLAQDPIPIGSPQGSPDTTQMCRPFGSLLSLLRVTQSFSNTYWAVAIFIFAGVLVHPVPSYGKAMILGSKAKQEIQSLLQEKMHRTPVQKKMSSRLLHMKKMRRREHITQNVAALRTGVKIARDGTTEIDIRGHVSESVLAQIEGLGGDIINSFPQYDAIRARLPFDRIEDVANLPQVEFIRPADEMITNSHDTNAVNVSEGDHAHRADLARSSFGIDGSGITIGVLSDGVDSLAARQASGDLPSNITVLSGQAGSGDEGTAMLEIVHDLAPGANLMFATAFGGEASFASNIEALQTAGANVIVDDVFYFAEPAFQDGIIAQAVDTVAANGALYFSSAGNSGNFNDGTTGVWEGDFVPMLGPSVLGAGVIAHDFGGGSSSTQITVDPPSWMIFWWSDPLGGSTNDYDVFLLNADLTAVLAASTNIQNGSQDPLEFIDSGTFNDVNSGLVIVQNAGASDRFLHLNTHRGRLSIGTDGQTLGHSAADSAFGVAAVYVGTAGGGAFTGGAANPIETFSSDGPRRVFYDETGIPLTPGNVSSTGGIVRQKPDIAAADGVSTSTPGFGSFFGTSAAAPHAAAIAGLVLSANPGLTTNDVRVVLQTTALDIESAGIDRDSGYGIVDAFSAVQFVIPVPTFEVSVTVEGNGFGTVVSIPSSLDCPTVCIDDFPINTNVQLTANVQAGSTFDGWQGCDSVNGNQCDLLGTEDKNVTATFSLIPPPDTISPVVTMTSPQDGETVTGMVTISATATDVSGVAGVQFLLDGVEFNSEDIQAPYSVAWDSTSVEDGVYVWNARARDTVGNEATSAGITISVVHPPPTPAYLQGVDGDGLVVMEAEHAHGNTSQGSHSWQLSTQGGQTGTGVFQALPNTGTNQNTDYVTMSPHLDFDIEFVQTGVHYIWLRGSGASGGDDSVHVGLDGQAVASADRMKGFGLVLDWSQATMDNVMATVTVTTTGRHTLNLWMREDGFVVDKVLVTTNLAYIPNGAGPTESPLVGEPPPPSAPAYRQATDGEGLVVMEAENAHRNIPHGIHSWVLSAQAGQTGTGVYQVLPNTGINLNTDYVTFSPHLDFDIEFVHTGVHYVWIRGSGAGGGDDSLHVGLDGQAVVSADRMKGFGPALDWSQATMDGAVATIIVTSTGLHTLNLWMREDGFVVDKVVLTINPTYIPIGTGPEEIPQN